MVPPVSRLRLAQVHQRRAQILTAVARLEEARAEALALEELEDHVGRAVGERVPVEDLDDVGVAQRGGRARFGFEAGEALAIAARAVATEVVQMPCGSCSTQPGEGKICGNSSCAKPTGDSAASNRNARVEVVP